MTVLRSTVLTLPLAVAALTLACGGGSDPLADVAAANAAVTAQQKKVDAAVDAVSAREREVNDAQDRLREAQEKVQEEQRELERLAALVDHSAVDTALFRAVQQRLLHAPDLANAAIVATVSGGVVTLSGTVQSEKLEDHAIEVASKTRGVKSVDSRIRVQAAP